MKKGFFSWLSGGKASDEQANTPTEPDVLEPAPAPEAEVDVPAALQADAEQESTVEAPALDPALLVTQDKPKRAGLFSRLVQGLKRTRENLGAGFVALFRGKQLDDELFEELETQLLSADLGVATTSRPSLCASSVTLRSPRSFGSVRSSPKVLAALMAASAEEKT